MLQARYEIRQCRCDDSDIRQTRSDDKVWLLTLFDDDGMIGRGWTFKDKETAEEQGRLWCEARNAEPPPLNWGAPIWPSPIVEPASMESYLSA